MAVFSPDGRRVATAGTENDILLFDAFTGQRLSQLEGHAQSLDVLVFSDDGNRLLSASVRPGDPWWTGRRLLSQGLDL
jgi:WD40 repeat protein